MNEREERSVPVDHADHADRTDRTDHAERSGGGESRSPGTPPPGSTASSSAPAPRRFSYLVRGLLAAGTFAFALPLSAGDRGVVDFVVLGALGAAILYNTLQLARRLHAHRGVGAVWHVLCAVLSWLLGGWNTLWIRPEDVGSVKNWIGWIALALAVLNSILLWREERDVLAHPSDGTARSA
jgi:hypothetical protein